MQNMSSENCKEDNEVTKRLETVELSDSDGEYESADDAEPEPLDDPLAGDEETSEPTKTVESEDSEHENDTKSEKDKEADEKAKEFERRKEAEALLSEDEKAALKDKAQDLKTSGNAKFKEQKYDEAIADYTEALSICPLCFIKERSVLCSNRAAAYSHLGDSEKAIKDCNDSIELHPHYVKPLLRRAQLYEKTDKLDEALEDYKKVVELDRSCSEAFLACQRLPDMINERNEKLKTEMMGKLKDLGNLFLRPFGMSTDNFQFVQNETGGYSVNFVNNQKS